MHQPTCAQCSVDMERGFTVDRSHHNFGQPTKWVSGEPERSFMFGVKTGGRRRLFISAYRCPRCGRVDLYAPEA